MIFLIFFAFIAGFVTVLSPCILPLLPIILSSSSGTDRQKPVGIILGFIFSFTFFTLFLTTLVNVLHFPPQILRYISITILIFFGLSLIITRLQIFTETFFSYFSRLISPRVSSSGLWGGFVVGLSLGVLWTPCVGPILASVISLAITGTVTGMSFLIILAYSVGTAIPLLIIMIVGSSALQRVPGLVKNAGKIQKTFGLVMVLTSLGLFFNLDRKFQVYILNNFPNYGPNLTQFESKLVDKSPQSLDLLKGPLAPEFSQNNTWLNSKPLSLSTLKGKVVLIDFWTYTCINCIRTFPHLNAWYNKYHDQGLVIIGVHTPEFEFEKDTKNVQKSLVDFGINYPVVQDNDYQIWNSYNNHYWPAEYLIDQQGHIVHSHFGEGEYDVTEKTIQTLLNTTTSLDSNPDLTPKSPLSPESYLGSARAEFYYPNSSLQIGQSDYILQNNLPLHSFSFGGTWDIATDQSTSVKNSTLNYHFNASKVFLVLRPPLGQKAMINVYLDDKLNSNISIDSDKLYTLFNSTTPEEHILKIEFLTPGTQAFAFTFG